MKIIKEIACILIAIFCTITTIAQINEPLNQVNDLLKDPYAKPDKIDQAAANLRAVAKNKLSRTDEQLLLTLFQKVAKAYEANNHFKQACEVYDNYLACKETFLGNEKSALIMQEIMNADSVKKATEGKVVDMQQELAKLQAEQQHASSRSSGIIKYFIFGILIILCIFIIVLLKGNQVLKRNKAELENGRKRLIELQHDRILGYHYHSLIKAMSADMNTITNNLESLTIYLADIRKSLSKEEAASSDKIRESVLKAEKEAEKIRY